MTQRVPPEMTTGLATTADINAAIAAQGLGTASTKNVGVAAGNVVQLDGSAKLPAVDGSQLTNIPNGTVLLASGVVANSATSLDLVLTGYTGFRELKFVMTGWVPATDGAKIQARFSTDGGSNYLSATNYAYVISAFTTTVDVSGRGSGAAQIQLMGSNASCCAGNLANEGCDFELTLFNQTDATKFTRCNFQGAMMNNAATAELVTFAGSGAYYVAQDTDAIRFFWSAGNFAAANPGNYAVYGLK